MLNEGDSAEQVRVELRKTQLMIGTDGSDGKEPSGLTGRIIRESRSRFRSILAVAIVGLVLLTGLFWSTRYTTQQNCKRGNIRSRTDVTRLYAQDREYARALGGTDAQADAVTKRILADNPPLVRACPQVIP